MSVRDVRLGALEGSALVRLARAAIRDELARDGALGRALEVLPRNPALEAPRGAFVTLRERSSMPPGALRGCIGSLSRELPLYRAVIDAAQAAAFRDPRFRPLERGDLERIELEVSALTGVEPLADPRSIVLGRHGVQLTRGERRALFLPQVAIEQRWSVEQLLEQLARKAGLPPEDWRGAVLEVFEAEVFGEALPAPPLRS